MARPITIQSETAMERQCCMKPRGMLDISVWQINIYHIWANCFNYGATNESPGDPLGTLHVFFMDDVASQNHMKVVSIHLAVWPSGSLLLWVIWVHCDQSLSQTYAQANYV